jgi:putative SOS response-associated peptidase YedK
MCGRITQEEKQFQLEFKIHDKEWKKQLKYYNIGIGDTAFVIPSSGELVQMRFGFNKGGRLNFNGRAEGFNNKDNQRNYTGKYGIHTNPNYVDAFRNGRCLIPVTSFLEGPEDVKLSKPHKIKLNYTELFYLAGVTGVDEKTGEHGFSIITCWPNQIINEVVGHHRLPAILDDPDSWQAWLNPESDINDMLHLLKPVNDGDLEITPISPQYKSAKYTEPY